MGAREGGRQKALGLTFSLLRASTSRHIPTLCVSYFASISPMQSSIVIAWSNSVSSVLALEKLSAIDMLPLLLQTDAPQFWFWNEL